MQRESHGKHPRSGRSWEETGMAVGCAVFLLAAAAVLVFPGLADLQFSPPATPSGVRRAPPLSPSEISGTADLASTAAGPEPSDLEDTRPEGARRAAPARTETLRADLDHIVRRIRNNVQDTELIDATNAAWRAQQELMDLRHARAQQTCPELAGILQQIKDLRQALGANRISQEEFESAYHALQSRYNRGADAAETALDTDAEIQALKEKAARASQAYEALLARRLAADREYVRLREALAQAEEEARRLAPQPTPQIPAPENTPAGP